MKIIGIAIERTYRFNCPVCGSKLECEGHELNDIGGRVKKFFCPICKKDRYISWSELRKRTVYDTDDSIDC